MINARYYIEIYILVGVNRLADATTRRRAPNRPGNVPDTHDGDEPFEFNLRVDIPSGVSLHRRGEKFTNEFAKSATINSGYAERLSFEVSHSSGERRTDVLSVLVDSDGGSITREIELELET